jgi:hypothetical protein
MEPYAPNGGADLFAAPVAGIIAGGLNDAWRADAGHRDARGTVLEFSGRNAAKGFLTTRALAANR